MKPRVTRLAVHLLLSFTMTSGLCAAGKTVTEPDGKIILQERCGHCHSIEKIGRSPLGNAPPLRNIYRRYPMEQLEFELAEGVGSRHKDMPQIQFSSEQINKILTYLQSIADTN